MQNLSFYVHIPYCVKRCGYCDFNTYTPAELRDGGTLEGVSEGFIDSLIAEVTFASRTQTTTIPTIFFGGGTPSLMPPALVDALIAAAEKHWGFAPDIEITLEANPDDLDKNFLKALANTEINRLSIGTQSFFEEDLKLMNRAHNASEAESSIKRAQDLGFENLSIDLIYGSPTSNFEIWKEKHKEQ